MIMITDREKFKTHSDNSGCYKQKFKTCEYEKSPVTCSYCCYSIFNCRTSWIFISYNRFFWAGWKIICDTCSWTFKNLSFCLRNPFTSGKQYRKMVINCLDSFTRFNQCIQFHLWNDNTYCVINHCFYSVIFAGIFDLLSE